MWDDGAGRRTGQTDRSRILSQEVDGGKTSDTEEGGIGASGGGQPNGVREM